MYGGNGGCCTTAYKRLIGRRGRRAGGRRADERRGELVPRNRRPGEFNKGLARRGLPDQAHCSEQLLGVEKVLTGC